MFKFSNKARITEFQFIAPVLNTEVLVERLVKDLKGRPLSQWLDRVVIFSLLMKHAKQGDFKLPGCWMMIYEIRGPKVWHKLIRNN